MTEVVSIMLAILVIALFVSGMWAGASLVKEDAFLRGYMVECIGKRGYYWECD